MVVWSPSVVIVAGPNESGKSTVAPGVVHRWMGITRFVNADTFAAGLSAFDTESAAIEAGRIMLRRTEGYRVHLVFLWLASPELAIARVANRVQEGGHNVPDDVIRRRYHRGLSNLFDLYLPTMDTWRIFNATEEGMPKPIARLITDDIESDDEKTWERMKEFAKVQQQHHSDIESRIRDTEGVHEALRQGVEEAVRRHVLAGRRIPVWREGQVVWITPDVSPAEQHGTHTGTATHGN